MEPSSPIERLNVVRAAGIFDPLETGLLDEVAAELETVSLFDGDWLFRQGEAGDAMYVLHQGLLRVTVRRGGVDNVVAQLAPGSPVGEIQVLSGGTRTASAQAVGETTLIKLPAACLVRLLERAPTAMRQVAELIRRRLLRNHQREILADFFGPLDEFLLASVESEGEWVRLPPGGILFEAGSAADGFYLVISGRLRAVRPGGEGVDRVLGDIRRGESIGEMGVLTGEPRAATVEACRDSDLLRFSKAAFEDLVHAHPRLLLQITRILVTRLSRHAEAPSTSPGVTAIALVPASDGLVLDDFALELSEALDRHGPARRLNSRLVDSLLGTPGAAQTPPADPRSVRISVWLDECEAHSHFVLYQTDRNGSEWSRRCLERCDEVWIIARADDDPEPSGVERELITEGPGVTVPQVLVLLHPGGTDAPRGTRRWLERRRLLRHHHLRRRSEDDVERLARFAAGRAVGAALSGGGARALAHVGVLRALEGAGLPIDALAGAGLGAHVAAGVALGWNAPTLLENGADAFRSMSYDLTLPIVSLSSGRSLARRLRAQLGEVRIEDLWLPYCAVASNLTNGAPELLRHGELWRAVRASNGLPGVLPPLVQEGDLLVDGCFGAGLPARAIRELCDGPILAVDVSPQVDLSSNAAYGDSLSGWRVLWQRINPFARPVELPALLAILQRAGETSDRSNLKVALRRGDLSLRLPLEGHGLLDFGAAQSIAEAGYGYARERIAPWREGLATQPPTAGQADRV